MPFPAPIGVGVDSCRGQECGHLSILGAIRWEEVCSLLVLYLEWEDKCPIKSPESKVQNKAILETEIDDLGILAWGFED